MDDHPTPTDYANRFERDAAYWREECEALAAALHDVIDMPEVAQTIAAAALAQHTGRLLA